MSKFIMVFTFFVVAVHAKGQKKIPFPVVNRPPIPCAEGGELVADYRISNDHPMVYISFIGRGKALNPLDTHLLEVGDNRQSKEDGKDYWFRLVNNSVWAISITTYGNAIGKKREMVKLPDGKFAFSVSDGLEVAIFYKIQRSDGRRIAINLGIDMFSTSWIPPGRSILFSVPRKIFRKDRELIVNFGFEWEKGQYSAPSHQVRLTTLALP